MSRPTALARRSRFLSHPVDSVLLGGNMLLGGLWLNRPAVQVAGLSMAALSPLIASLMMRLSSRTAPRTHRSHEEEALTRADHSHFLAASMARASTDASGPGINRLAGPVPTRNASFQALQDLMCRKTSVSLGPVVLLGPSGTGKSELARLIHELRKSVGLRSGAFVEVACSEFRNEPHLTSLFGNTKGAYTGADAARGGLLAQARGGTLFLDEVGELSIEQQGILLRVLNQKRYRPMGQDAEVTTDAAFTFATLRDLEAMVDAGQFRIDLFKRISMFSYTLPGLAERPEDFDALIEFQLDVLERALGLPITFDADALEAYLALCRSPLATWPGNLRDLAYSLERMASNEGRRVDMAEVEAEAEVLMREWTRERRGSGLPPPSGLPVQAPAPAGVPVAPMGAVPVGAVRDDAQAQEAELPPLVRGKLWPPERAEVLVYVRACREHVNIGDAAEAIWYGEPDVSRRTKAERLRKKLLVYGLTFETARER